METQKITFTITKIGDANPFNIETQSFDFPTGNGDEKEKITKMFFVGDEVGQIKDTFQDNKTYQMTFDESEVEDDRTPTMMASSSSDGAAAKKIPNAISIREGELGIFYHNHNGSIKLEEVKKGDTNKPEQTKSNDNQKTPPPGNEEKKQPGPNQKDDKGPDKDNPQQPEPKDTPDSPQDKKTPDQPPKNPEPSSEQVKQASDKLDQAKNSNNKEDIKNSLNETNDTVRNSSDKDLKKKKEEAEKRLSEIAGKEELRKVIRDEVSNELKKLGIKPEDLSSTKQKFDNLNNNNNNIEPSQAQEYRTEVLNEAASKKLNELITKLEQAIKKNDKKEIESEKQKLTTFTQDNSDYVQKAYQTQKDKIQQLLEKAKNQQSNQNNKNDGFFRPNNPVMWISGAAIIGLVVGVVLIARSRRKKVAIK